LNIHDVFRGTINPPCSIFINPGISILSGLAIVGVTEPLALPWVALGTVTPFILGYRVLGGEVVRTLKPISDVAKEISLYAER
jgi:hypothetical protein